MTTRSEGVEEEEAMAAAALVPPWLEPLLATPFFSPCAIHGDAARGECNMFCLDCPAAAGFCFYCRSSRHADHRVIQIRRSSYHDVVRVTEVQRSLDIAGVQTYVINSARVLFLNERPQPKGGSSSSSSAAAGPSKSAVHTCEICGRTLLDSVRFCSLGCKLQGIKRTGDACFVLKDDSEGGGGVPPAPAPAPPPRRRQPERRRAGEEREGLREQAGHAMHPATPPSNPRRRKGIPRRAPLAS